jgi:hypothetical protein
MANTVGKHEWTSRLGGPPMQPLAVLAIASGVVMVAGVSAALFLTRHSAKPRPGGINRWLRHGSIPLAGAALALRVVSRSSGQSPATHNVIFVTAGALLVGALLCAVAAAMNETRRSRAR